MQDFGFAMDQGERATFETSFVTGHLKNVLNQRSEKGVRQKDDERIFLISLLTKYCNEASKHSQTRRFL